MKLNHLFLLFALILCWSCSKEDNTPPDTNKYLIAAQQQGSASTVTLAFAMQQQGYGEYTALLKTGVSLHRVSYKTQYPQGTATQASGVFILPDDLKAGSPLTVYTHGTLFKDEAPSQHINGILNFTMDVFLASMISSAFNCVVLLPDYIGYGDSESITHPYVHKTSLAQASYDFIKTYEEYTAIQGLPFNNRLLITGYSEGGYAAVALQEKIQQTSGAGLQTVKTIAGSGPYDHEAMAKQLLAVTTPLNSYHMASFLWTIGMYKTDYQYSKSYDYIFSAEDNEVLKENGYNFGYFATDGLPIHSNPAELFTPAFISGVQQNTDTEFITILRNNSLVDYAPADSLIFVYGAADDWVVPVNTLNAYNAMLSKGCKVKKYEDPAGDHYSTMGLYLAVLLSSMKGL